MKLLRALEAGLVRVEGAVAVALVLVMLALAGYNVVYRNVLVPMQKHWAHSGPVPEAPTPPPTKAAAKQSTDAPEPSGAEGFAGDWGEGGDEDDAEEKVEEKVDEKADEKADGAEGFAGDWGEGGDEDAEPADAKDSEGDSKDAAPPEEDDFHLAKIDAVTQTSDGEPLGGPPPPGSFAANMVSFIDSIKLGWIDVVLRQFVILVAFFGAMMATQRGKHINVDALSKLLNPARQRWLSVATNLLATCVCIVFAKAGSALVGISREHPHELVPWADEWIFQLMFPLGFGLLAFHFAVRVAEAATGTAPEPSGGAA